MAQTMMVAFLLMTALGFAPAYAANAALGVNPGVIMNYDMYQLGPFSQPSLFYGPITAKDLRPPAKDPNLIQVEDGVLPSNSSTQGIIHTEDGHIYISP